MDHYQITPAQSHALQEALADIARPSQDAQAPKALLERCPAAAATPLLEAPALAKRTGVAHVHLKDERARMGLGSFKALGAAYVIACDAAKGEARGKAYYTASAGNHGLSVAAGAKAFGARAVIYLAQTVPEAFATRLESFGAEVRWRGEIYEEAMAAAMQDAEAEGAVLLSDSSWSGYTERPWRLMEGYLVLMAEAAEQMPAPPTHIFLQAGVGGLAAACATYARHVWGSAPRIIIVEPEAAPAIYASVKAGLPVATQGPASAMGRLDCKEPSLIALKGLAADATDCMVISEQEGAAGAEVVAQMGWPSTPSGAAGVAGLLALANPDASPDASPDANPGANPGASPLGLGAEARVLAILSEAE